MFMSSLGCDLGPRLAPEGGQALIESRDEYSSASAFEETDRRLHLRPHAAAAQLIGTQQGLGSLE